MNPSIPDEHQNVLEQVAKYTQSIRQLLADDDVDAESRLEVHDLLTLLETSTADAMQEVQSILAEAEETASALRAKLQQKEPRRPRVTAPPPPVPSSPDKEDPELGYRLGYELLCNFGYLSQKSSAGQRELRTIFDWVRESLSLAPNPDRIEASEKSSGISAPNAGSSRETAPSTKPSPHIDIGWTTWLLGSVAQPEDRKDEKKPANPEDLWQDIFN